MNLVRTITPVLSAVATAVALFAAVVTMAFVTIALFIINELRKLKNERKLNEDALKSIAEHSQRIAEILKQVGEVKLEIRDASLQARSKVVSDAEYTTFIKEVIGKTPTVAWVNFLKDFVWREKISLDELKPAVLDKKLQDEIATQYKSAHESGLAGLITYPDMSAQEKIRWAYEILSKGKTIASLLDEERQYNYMLGGIVQQNFVPGNINVTTVLGNH